MLQTKRSNRQEIASQQQRVSLEEVDRPSPYPTTFCLSRTGDDDVRVIGKHDFRSVLLHPMLSNANLGKDSKTVGFPNC